MIKDKSKLTSGVEMKFQPYSEYDQEMEKRKDMINKNLYENKMVYSTDIKHKLMSTGLIMLMLMKWYYTKHISLYHEKWKIFH